MVMMGGEKKTMTTSVIWLVVALGVLALWPLESLEARPFNELYKNYEHRSALNQLKELDKYYSQVARPRFGKRFSPVVEGSDEDEVPPIFDHGNYRWILINRNQPLTKLTENYLREILADNNKRQQAAS